MAEAATARDALRAATEAAHLRLHTLPDFAALAAGRLDRAGYVKLLGRLLGFHLAFEQRLAEMPGIAAFGIRPAERRRTPLLRDDLGWLGAEVGPCGITPLPPFADVAEAMGGLYVTEGSTLGGRQLARALEGWLPGEGGRRFLLGHGADHGRMWRECCAAIEACGSTRGGLEGMIRGATATFAAFEDWFAAASLPA